MAAGIVESANAALRIANDDDRIRADLYGHIGTGLRQLAIMADKQPVLVENILQIQLVIFWIGVEFCSRLKLGSRPVNSPSISLRTSIELNPCFPSWICLLLFSQRLWLDPVFPLSSGSTAYPVISMACPHLPRSVNWLPLF